MLKMLFRSRSWKCCYVEDVFTLKMLKMLLCWKKEMCFSLMVLRGIMTSLWDPWKHWKSINMQFYWFPRNNIKWRTWKHKTSFNRKQHTWGMLSACWSRSMCFHAPTTKHCKKRWKWHVQFFLQLHFNCVPGNLKPLSYIYIYIYVHSLIHTHTDRQTDRHTYIHT